MNYKNLQEIIDNIDDCLINPFNKSRDFLEDLRKRLVISLENGYELQKVNQTDILWIDKWLEIFPDVKSGGKKVRQDPELCARKMKTFITKYGYTPEQIMKATKNYVEERALHGYAFMMLSGNFVSHREKGSLLLEHCQELEKGVEPKEYYVNSDII